MNFNVDILIPNCTELHLGDLKMKREDRQMRKTSFYAFRLSKRLYRYEEVLC
jgi:hypothetical protein